MDVVVEVRDPQTLTAFRELLKDSVFHNKSCYEHRGCSDFKERVTVRRVLQVENPVLWWAYLDKKRHIKSDLERRALHAVKIDPELGFALHKFENAFGTGNNK